MTDIKRLLSKKGWTGEEVGKALIASLLNDIRHIGQEYELLFTPDDFRRMEDSLKTERDVTAYGVYRDIYSSLVDHYNKANCFNQQFYNGYYRYLMYLTGAIKADDALKRSENYPIIMTAEQYQRAKEEASARFRGIGVSYYDLIFSLLEDFISNLENGEEVPAEIREALENTKREPAKGHAIYSSYNELMGEGYLQLPDGRRSDEMSGEEWQKAVKELYQETHKLVIDGRPASFEETLEHYNGDRQAKAYALFFKGIEAINKFLAEAGEETIPEDKEQEVLTALEQAIVFKAENKNPLIEGLYNALGFGCGIPTEWHLYKEPPAYLTAYDLLELIADSARWATVNETEQLKTFKKEYKELYTALDAYIKAKIPKAKQLKPSQLCTDFITWGELAELGMGRYSENVTIGDTEIRLVLQDKGQKSADSTRASVMGIAVIQNPLPYQLDENGNYKEGRNPIDDIGSIDDLAQNTPLNLYDLRDKLFIPALSFLYAYNALVEIMGAVYDIDGIEVAELSTGHLEELINSFNNILYMFYFEIYGDKKEKARKRKLIKELFAPLDVETIKPTEEAKEAVKEKLLQLGLSSSARKALADMDSLIAELDNREGAC